MRSYLRYVSIGVLAGRASLDLGERQSTFLMRLAKLASFKRGRVVDRMPVEFDRTDE